MKTAGGSALALLLCFALVGVGSALSFNQLFNIWTPNHVVPTADGQGATLVLDQYSAAAFGSKNTYLYGTFCVYAKLHAGDSAGTVTTFYMSSSGYNHDEIDFEFLGNLTGQPYLLHTNVFANGVGGREEQIYLWFDPTIAYHNYCFIWTKNTIVWTVDNTAIRTFKNEPGQFYPDAQPMGVYGSEWDGSQWATEGGRIKLNYADSPFTANYASFTLNGNQIGGANTVQSVQNSPAANVVADSLHRENQIKWVKKFYLHYFFCTDKSRYPTPPASCYYNTL